jgi:PAS domain S-box-containing protein
MNPGFSSDIGDSKNTGNPLVSSAQRVTAILDGITDGFVLVDFEWRYTYANTSAARFLRKAKEEIVGRKVFDVFPEAKGTVFERNFRKAMEERVTVSFAAFYKPLLSWFECHCYPSPEGISVLFADATEKKHQRRGSVTYTANCSRAPTAPSSAGKETVRSLFLMITPRNCSATAPKRSWASK